jgi:hypothetical protein
VRVTGAPDTTQDVSAVPNAGGVSSLPAASQDWVTTHGGTVAPDSEVELGLDLAHAGAGTIELAHQVPGRPERLLDSWAVHVSRYATFADHVAWPGGCITVSYDPSGRTEHPPCPAVDRWSKVVQAIDSPIRMTMLAHGPAVLHGVKELADRSREIAEQAGAWLKPFPFPGHGRPHEPGATPADWVLDPDLVAQLQPLGSPTAARYVEFLREAGTRIAPSPAHPLAGLADPVGTITVEAVCDAGGHVLALWLRTPEPLDFQRVTVTGRVRHVEPETGCPDEYANRTPLDLTFELLPSPDASAALLVGRFAGSATRLPRGEYTVTLRFDAAAAGLPRLRPSAGGTEATIAFLQPLGDNWPVVHEGSVLPWEIVKKLLEKIVLRPPWHRPGPIPEPEPWWRDIGRKGPGR